MDLTEPDTLGITIAEIALNHLSPYDIKTHGAKGAGRHAGAAADAHIVVNHCPT